MMRKWKGEEQSSHEDQLAKAGMGPSDPKEDESGWEEEPEQTQKKWRPKPPAVKQEMKGNKGWKPSYGDRKQQQQEARSTASSSFWGRTSSEKWHAGEWWPNKKGRW